MFEIDSFPLFEAQSDLEIGIASLNGSALNDSMVGGEEPDSLFGLAGDDTMLGAGGDDWLSGNQGRDWLNGNQGQDTAYGGKGQDILYGGQGSDMLVGNLAEDWLSGNRESDTMYGGQENDILYGGQGDDALFGDRGNDTIFGDKGSDTLTGGDGQDVFVIASGTGGSNSGSSDVIVDLNPSQDQIQLENGLTFDNLSLTDTGNGVTIQIAETGEFLAVVQGVDTEALQRDRFISLRPVDTAGNTLAEARNINITETPQTVSDFVGDVDPVDLYKFEIDQDSRINFKLDGLSADADLTLIQDLNNDGDIDFNEFLDSSSESDNNSEQLNTILKAGTYFIQVEKFEGDTTYTLEFSAEKTDEIPEDGAGNTLAEARNINLTETPQTFSDFIGDLDPIDLYKFEIDQASILNMKLEGLSADAELLLYQDKNGDGELGPDEIVSVSEQSGTADESIENITLDPGTYFLAVEQFEGDTNYNLSVAGVAGTIAADLAGDGPSSARVLPLNGTVELYDYLGGTDTVDTYRFEVRNGGYLDVLAIHKDKNPKLELTLWSDLNSNNQLDDDETITQETDEIFLNKIESGTYFVNVTAPEGATPYGISAISQPGSSIENERYKSLLPNSSLTGILDEDDFIEARGKSADPYLLSFVDPGSTVKIDQTSEDFDPSLTVVDKVTGDTIATNDSNTQGGDRSAQVSFTAEEGKQYVVYASSKSAGSGEYNLKTTVTGTPTPTHNDSSSSDSTTKTPEPSAGLPKPIFQETDSNHKPENEYNFTYQALTGGKVEDNSIKIRDLNQGSFGNCYFIAGLAATFGKIKGDLSDVDKESEVLKDNIDPGENNSYNFVLYKGGDNTQKTQYTVDNQVITRDTINGKKDPDNGALFGVAWTSDSVQPAEASDKSIWASLYERAYALSKGGYKEMGNGGYEGNALVDITGKKDNLTSIDWEGGAKRQEFSMYQNGKDSYVKKEEVFESIQTTLNEGGYAAAGTKQLPTNKKSDKETLYNGVLYQSHAYSIHNAYVNKDGDKLILLRNPHGIDNDKNKFAEEDPNQKNKNKDSQDGFITITFEAFIDNFEDLALVKA